ncbi:MAG: hypothetical protein IKS32_07105 [Solobacterium sp.]|nr:hypothetical protein [Solobacterium sp.]
MGKQRSVKNSRRKKRSFQAAADNLLITLFSVFMTGVFVLGVISFFRVPPLAKKEAAEIEETLRRQQEEAERLRKQKEKELAEKRAAEEKEADYQRRVSEELEANPLLGKYSDASELHITGIGDSVMLGAVSQLYETFPEGVFDAVFGRTIYDGKNVLIQMEQNGTLGDVVLFSLGTNSYIEESDIEELIEHCGSRPSFWLSTYGVSNDSNQKMEHVTSLYDNAFMIDWNSEAIRHPSYILADGLHPTEEGAKAYAELIRSVINDCVLTSKVTREGES